MRFNNKAMVAWFIWWASIWSAYTVPDLLTTQPSWWTVYMFVSGLLMTWVITAMSRALYRTIYAGFIREVLGVNWKFLKGDI